jgi:hypothetical protein
MEMEHMKWMTYPKDGRMTNLMLSQPMKMTIVLGQVLPMMCWRMNTGLGLVPRTKLTHVR